jgi:hypothetical protein
MCDAMNKIDLAEYAQLKAEQASRVQSRDTVINYNVVAIGVIASLSGVSGWSFWGLAAVPWVSFIFGWQYLMHDQKVTAIGRYLADLALRRNAPDALAWERSQKRVVGARTWHRSAQLTVDSMTFVLPCLVAPIALLLLTGVVTMPLICFLVIGFTLGGALEFTMIRTFLVSGVNTVEQR